MQKRFVSTSTHILDPANPSTPPIRPSPPPEVDPLAPDPNDKRTLFDKLAASKAQKQEAFEEAYKFSNLIKRLDDKESDFLTALQSEQLKEEQEKKRVEGEQLDAFKKAQSQIDVVRPSTQDIIAPPPPPVKRRTSSSVKGVLVKRKSETQGGDVKRRRSSVTESPRIDSPSVSSKSPTPAILTNSSPPKVNPTSSSPNPSAPKNGAQVGLSAFAHYSDSEEDSD